MRIHQRWWNFRKIFASADRERIRKILNKFKYQEQWGNRTAGLNKTKNEIDKDFQNTIKTWEVIRDYYFKCSNTYL